MKFQPVSPRLGTTCVLSLLALSLVTARPAAANQVINGSFEDPNIPTPSWTVFGSIPGWTKSFGHSIEIQDHVAGSPLAGDQFVELDSYAPSGMYQDVATATGQNYLLRFGYSPRPGVFDNTIRVFWGGSLLDTLSASGVGLPDTHWSYHTYSVTGGLGATTRLEFADVSHPDSLGGYLDDVSVTTASTTPEPTSMGLLGSGLLGLFLRRRRQQQEA